MNEDEVLEQITKWITKLKTINQLAADPSKYKVSYEWNDSSWGIDIKVESIDN